VREENIMILKIKERNRLSLAGLFIAALVLLFVSIAFGGASKATQKQKTFSSPEDAVKSVVAAARTNDDRALHAIFGPSARDLIFSGDSAADKQRRERFLKAYDEKNSLVPEGDNMIIVIGKDNWPFPIPIVKEGDVWFFDTDKGKEEILNRRIGENELDTIQTLLAIVDAEREYAMKYRSRYGIPVYAEKFLSDPGKKNGLYWESKEGEEPSPLGPAVAQARKEGYTGKKSGDKPSPFHGYYYRILKAQGKNAPGGAYEYVVRGKMRGGFGVVASPAKYGNSGVMTFIVNHDGVVYQKDLGKNTAKAFQAMKKFDPDTTWKKVETESE
jgi:hypothetical protein